MAYKILEAHIVFTNEEPSQIKEVTVLVDCTSGSSKEYSDVRAITVDNKPKGGYYFLGRNSKLSESLLQDLAGGGYGDDLKLASLFKGWKGRLNK